MHLKPKTNGIVNESVYVVKWTDRNYKEKSKKFKDDPNGPPENGRIKAEKFKSSLEKKDANDKFGNIRDISIVIESHKTMHLKHLIRATVREALEAQLGPSGGSRRHGAYATRIDEARLIWLKTMARDIVRQFFPVTDPASGPTVYQDSKEMNRFRAELETQIAAAISGVMKRHNRGQFIVDKNR